MPVQDVTSATSTQQISAESVSFSDGAAGTTQRIKLTYDGVMSQYGERIGVDGDSSFSFITGTVLTTEVPWRFKNTEGKDNETERLSTLSNGEFMVDYENGYVLGKSATSTSTSTDTVNYKVRINAITSVGGGTATAANQTTQITAEQAIQTSVQLIDDAVFTDDVTTFTPGTTKGMLGGLVVDETSTDTADEGDIVAQRGSARRAGKVDLDTKVAGEDQTNDVMKTEQQFTTTRVTADGQIKASAGFVHAVTISPTTATPTAGLVTIYNNTAESGTILFSEWFFATDEAHTIELNTVASTGIYVGYDATATNLSVSVSFR